MDLNFSIDMKFNKTNVECDKHGITEALVNGNCRKCRDDKIAAKENEKIMQSLQDKKVKSNIKNRYLHVSFDNYVIENDKQKGIVDFIRSWNGNNDMLMLGSPGCGKTHLAIAKMESYLQTGDTAHYAKYYDLTAISIHNRQLYEHIKNVGLLVIDEYGRSLSDFKSSLLFELIDHRYDQQLSTILISNLCVKDFKESLDPGLYSRLKENSITLQFYWDDYRLKNKSLSLVKK